MSKKHIVPIAVLILIAALAAVYMRPLSLSDMTGTDVSGSEALQCYCRAYPDEKSDRIDVSESDAEYAELIELVTAKKYRRSLKSLLPDTGKSHPLRDGDYQWEITFIVETQLKSGETASGSLLRVEYYYDTVYVYSLDKHWICSVENEDAFSESVMDVISSRI